ncbi:MAG: PepSY-like domain-containing protein [Marinifilaceae bacterium]
MKTKLLLGAFAMSMVLNISCSKDDDNSTNAPSAALEKAFVSRYPNATNVKWIAKRGYNVALFDVTTRTVTYTQKNEAWFTDKAQWCMTETDIDVKDLPEAVIKGWEGTRFFTEGYVIDDVDVLMRGEQVAYKLEVELNDDEWDLVFNDKGELLSAKPDNGDDDNIPTPPAVEEFLLGRYKNVTIIECEEEEEKGQKFIKVEFLDDRSTFNEKENEYDGEHEALFTDAYKWLYTATEIEFADVPEVVKNAFLAVYSEDAIDDIEVLETEKDGVLYMFELETPEDAVVVFNAEGKEVKNAI